MIHSSLLEHPTEKKLGIAINIKIQNIPDLFMSI